MADRRLTQLVVEYEIDGDQNRRLTQLVVEYEIDEDQNRRLTQLVVEYEIDEDQNRRLTQLIIEFEIEEPTVAAADPPRVFELPWSPAYIQPAIEGQEHQYASFFGPQRHKADLGRRRIWTRYVRR